ncbi:MAG: hypothetical protein ACLP4V_30760 [Methylocella sp.]
MKAHHPPFFHVRRRSLDRSAPVAHAVIARENERWTHVIGTLTRNRWRRTAFESISGNVEIAPDDWTLLDPSGEPLARLYKVFGGPQDGRWYWTVRSGGCIPQRPARLAWDTGRQRRASNAWSKEPMR